MIYSSILQSISKDYGAIFSLLNYFNTNRLKKIEEENTLIILGFLSPIIIILFFLPSIISSLRNLKIKNQIIIVNIFSLIIFILIMLFNTPEKPELGLVTLFILWINGLIFTLRSNEVDSLIKANSNKEKTPVSQKINELKNLDELKKKGTITDDEFKIFKEKIMKS